VKGMEPGVEARIREAVDALEKAGATIEEVSLPHTDYGLATYYIVVPAEASANLARYDGVRYGRSIRLPGADFIADYLATRGDGFGPEVKRRIMLGTYALSAGYYDAFYLKAQKVRTLIKRDFDEVFESGIDALVAPTSPSVAFKFGARTADPVAMYLSDACTLPANMAGIAGVSLPCGLSDGLPVGLQFIGPPWSELELLRFGRAYEEPLPFDQQPLEAQATIDACAAAFKATGDARWREEAMRAYRWYLGHNDLDLPLATAQDGGCFDGLMPNGLNRNQGAESILALQLASCAISALGKAAITVAGTGRAVA